MVEEKAGLEILLDEQNSKNRFKKNKHACSIEGVLRV